MERMTITVEEAAAMLGISRTSAYLCVARGEIPAIRVGRRVVVPKAGLLAMLGVTGQRPPSAGRPDRETTA